MSEFNIERHGGDHNGQTFYPDQHGGFESDEPITEPVKGSLLMELQSKGLLKTIKQEIIITGTGDDK